MSGSISHLIQVQPLKSLPVRSTDGPITLTRYLLPVSTKGKELEKLGPEYTFAANTFNIFYPSFLHNLSIECPFGNLLDARFSYKVIGRPNLRVSLFLVRDHLSTSVVSIKWSRGHTVRRMNFEDQRDEPPGWVRYDETLTSEWRADRHALQDCWLFVPETAPLIN
jgi:hypothetical protein